MSLEITTTHVLEKGSRLLYQDGRSKWREFVVSGVDAEHASGNRAIGTYYCVWSVQDDLQGVTVSVMPGVQSPVTAGAALTSLLSTTNRWNKGTVTNTATGGASMYDRSAWEALSTLIEVWGGEIDTTITVAANTGVTARVVDLYSQQGNQTAKRRFDFGHDLQSVKRTYTDEPLYCRISPRGAGEETDAGGYGRKITIESVNSGRDYLEYSPMVSIARLPNGSGGYEYPTLIAENSNCKTPTELKTWAQSVLADYCTPKVSYEIDVLQAGIEGVDFSGVSLGDAVNIVDRKFSDDGLRVQGRVFSITTDLLNERDITIEIGSVIDSLSSMFSSLSKSYAWMSNSMNVMGNSLNSVQTTVNNMSTAQYISDLLDRINAEINATGGYTYITEGQGIRTYDRAVTNPLVGSEATKVVEIKGGSIRIANSKTAQGEWEWKTVFTSGHIAADLVTAANITTGYIGNASSGSYWDLDNNIFRIGTGAAIGSTTAGTLVSDTATAKSNASTALTNAATAQSTADTAKANAATAQSTANDAKKVATNYLTYDSTNGLDVGYSGTSAKTRISGSGVEIFDSGGVSALKAQVSNNVSTVRVGRDSGSGKVVLSSNGYVDLDYGSTNLAHFGYGSGAAESGTAYAPYYTLGTRSSGTSAGNYSTAIGTGNTASGYVSNAYGNGNTASGLYSMALGSGNTASGTRSSAIGNSNTASGINARALGTGLIAGYSEQVVIGKYNKNESGHLLEIGCGSSSTRDNALVITSGAQIQTKNPIKVAYGGTSQTDTSKRTDTGSISGTSYGELKSAQWARWGMVTMININISLWNDLEVPASGNITNVNVCNLGSGLGLRPAYNTVAVIPELGGTAVINTDGSINLANFNARGTAYTLAKSTNMYIRATYLTTLNDAVPLQ